LDWKETCPLRPEEDGTEKPPQKRVADVRFDFVDAARLLGGQLFVSPTNKIHRLPTRQREHSRAESAVHAAPRPDVPVPSERSGAALVWGPLEEPLNF
jgi:hypothetical protein